ncbi:MULTISPECIES: hypothetical protein [Vibrio]|uniref:hypothetical protein n=1 Tax=Vibrio TaxID=662 RepID=UPI00207541FC|nr:MULTISPECIES: hypothetical protein [Vibrio]USD35613.1 hypothetical protein J8Z27_22660 [Vibrio sp. SCSIO 43186]USD72737.1 hypothetical protein J4N41_22665 [Vibrio sp. SCSIO 43139]USD98942.1 hypothetical protein CTT30_22990 [Vibrio coralliilyticus]
MQSNLLEQCKHALPPTRSKFIRYVLEKHECFGTGDLESAEIELANHGVTKMEAHEVYRNCLSLYVF